MPTISDQDIKNVEAIFSNKNLVGLTVCTRNIHTFTRKACRLHLMQKRLPNGVNNVLYCVAAGLLCRVTRTRSHWRKRLQKSFRDAMSFISWSEPTIIY